MRQRTEHRELPPTAGLPPKVKDLWPWPTEPLANALSCLIGHQRSWVTCSGTAALVVALTALARHSLRREVIVPAWTCPLVAIAVVHCGLRLRLCDLRPNHFDMAPDALARLCGPTTLAIIPTHLAGRVADVTTASVYASACGASVIEDAAQSLGASHPGGIPVGTLGDIGIFSLAAGKGLSIYEGGLLTTRHSALHDWLQQAVETTLPRHTRRELRRSIEFLGYTALYNPCGLCLAYGRPLRRALQNGDPVGAVGDRFPLTIPLHRVGRWREAVAARAATRLPGFLDALQAQAQPRLQALRNIPGVTVLDDTPGARGTWPFLLLVLPGQAQRDAVLERLWTLGVGISRLFIHALPDYDYLRPFIDPIDVPNARDIAARSLTISNTLWMEDSTFVSILTVLESVLARYDRRRAPFRSLPAISSPQK